MELIEHSFALKYAEPGIFAVLYRTANVNRSVLAFHQQLQAQAELQRLFRQLEKLVGPVKGLAEEAKFFVFALPQQETDLQDFLKMSDLLIDRISALLNALEAKNLFAHRAIREAGLVFAQTRTDLTALRNLWAERLARFKAIDPSPELAAMLDEMTWENRRPLFDWGKPVGKEIW
jgi:mRNA interferase MazF